MEAEEKARKSALLSALEFDAVDCAPLGVFAAAETSASTLAAIEEASDVGCAAPWGRPFEWGRPLEMDELHDMADGQQGATDGAADIAIAIAFAGTWECDQMKRYHSDGLPYFRWLLDSLMRRGAMFVEETVVEAKIRAQLKATRVERLFRYLVAVALTAKFLAALKSERRSPPDETGQSGPGEPGFPRPPPKIPTLTSSVERRDY